MALPEAIPASRPSVPALELRDLFFASLNGLFIGIFVPFVFQNMSVALPVSRSVFALVLTIICVLGVSAGSVLSHLSRFGFFFQLAKFGLIGTANFVVDLGIFSLLVWTTGIAEGNSIIFFKIASVSIAIVNSYIWNKFWSFEEKRVDEATLRTQFFQFIAVSVSAMVLNTAITYLLINWVGDKPGFGAARWATASSAIASVATLLWNFVGYKFFVFRR